MTARRSPGVRALAVLLAALIVGLLVLFVVSMREMSLLAGLRNVASTWWGITTLADLGIGLVVVALWMIALERRPMRAFAWILALLLLGNLTTAVYLLLRCRRASHVRDVFMPALPR